MVKLALDVDKELRTNVIQAKKKDEGVYGKYSLFVLNFSSIIINVFFPHTELRITPETTRLDNIAFNPDAVIEPPRRRKGQPATGCCGGGGAANQAAESSNQKQ